MFACATMVPSRAGLVGVLQDAGLHAHEDHVMCARMSIGRPWLPQPETYQPQVQLFRYT